jgi:hypothetical protein
MFGIKKCHQDLLIPAHKPTYITHYDEYTGPSSLSRNFKRNENLKHINIVVFEGSHDVTVQKTKFKKNPVVNDAWA